MNSEMHGIYIAAILTSLLDILGFGTVIRKLRHPATGWLVFADCRKWLWTKRSSSIAKK